MVTEKARARLNREAIRLVSNKGGAYIKHQQFEPKLVQLFHADGVHYLFLHKFQGMIEKLLARVTYSCN